MSDFLFASRGRPPGVLRATLERYFASLPGTFAELHGRWGSLATFLPPHESHAPHDEAGTLSVLVGNPLVRLSGLPPRLLHHGNRRARIHALGAAPDGGLEAALDGHFALLSIDRSTGAGRVLTDRFAFVPVFATAAPASGLVIGTHVDAVAAAAGCDALDPVSIADFVANLCGTFPYTVYRDVRQLAAATDHRFSEHAWTGARSYWQPAEAPDPGSFTAAATHLREALLEGVAAVTADVDQGGLLLSGGEDSRAVLGAVPREVRIRAVTYAERVNREVRTARRVARAYGADFDVGYRSADHYVRHFPQVAALVGSHHGFFDVHGYNLATQLRLAAEPFVLGGLSADSLLKATYARPARGPYRSARSPGVNESLLRAVDERRNAFIEAIRSLRPGSAEEWLSLWPFAMRKHGGNVDGNRRMFRSFEAFHTTAVLDIAAAAPTAWKQERRLYRAALRPLLRRARFIPHTEYRFPYYGRLGNALLVPGLTLARTLRAAARGELRARHGSWPKWRTVALGMAEYERAVLASSTVPGLIADDAAALPALLPSWPPLRRFLLIQLGWLERHRVAQGESVLNSPVVMSSTATRPDSIT